MNEKYRGRMVRQTSIDCYYQIKAEGLLRKRGLQVYEAMLVKAPCTAGELERYINSEFHFRGAWKQLSVLRDWGVLCETGTRKCKATGRNVIEWDITDNLPDKKTVVKQEAVDELKDAHKLIALLNSMISGGEQHSEQSIALYNSVMRKPKTTK